jgi:hypothetical protein
MLEALTWLFRAIGIAPIARNSARSYQVSKLGWFITATHITVVLYCCYVYKTSYDLYLLEFRIPGVISDIYMESWWYLTACLRTTYVIAVLTTTGRYLKARNEMLVLKQKWQKLQTRPKRMNWLVEILLLILLTSILFIPFAVITWYEKPKTWEILVVYDCDCLYLPATLINFLLCLYEIKVNFDHIVHVLMKRIE